MLPYHYPGGINIGRSLLRVVFFKRGGFDLIFGRVLFNPFGFISFHIAGGNACLMMDDLTEEGGLGFRHFFFW
jgi:hypothetical protein